MISLICRNCGKKIQFNDMNLTEMMNISENKITDNVLNDATKESFQHSIERSLLNQDLTASQDGCFVEECVEKLDTTECVERVNSFLSDGIEDTRTPSLENLKKTLSALQMLQAYLIRNSPSNHKKIEDSTTCLRISHFQKIVNTKELKNESNNITRILQNLTCNYLLCSLCLSELRGRLQQAIQSCRNECSIYSDHLASALSREKESYDTLNKNSSISNTVFENENFSDPEDINIRRNLSDSQIPANTSKKPLAKHRKKRNLLCLTRVKCASKYPPPSSSAFVTSEQNTLHYNRILLSVLTRTNVVEDAFRIEVSGMYGVINGLRLGKMPEDSVSWNEVNAAWGQSAFLLDTIVQLILKVYMNYVRHSLKEKSVKSNSTTHGLNVISREFVTNFPTLTYLKTHKIVPRGNQSIVLRRSDMSCYELYRTDGGLTQYFATKRFNAAMVLFLEITREIITVACFLKNKLEKDEQTSIAPLKKINDMVHNSSINLPCSNGGESWCQCLKDLLLNCQWLLQLSKDIQNSFVLPREQ